MIWPSLGMRKKPVQLPRPQLRIAAAFNSLQRQEVDLNFVKRERWTEEQVVELPSGEHDYFERKAGQLFDNPSERNNLYDVLAKAASAFANSGGGHLILGVRNDGTFDGVSPIFSGRTPVREWLEQKLPELLDYTLADFRVHVAVRANSSAIPVGRDLIIIDFGDSSLAPHQSRRHEQYFYRSGGRSMPAPHFYLELVRQRLTNPSLDFELQGVDVDAAWKHEGSLFLRIDARVKIENKGRAAAYKWALVPRLINAADGRHEDYLFNGIPGSPGRMAGLRVDDTILPGCWLIEKKTFGVRLRPNSSGEQAMRDELRTLFGEMTLTMQLATETSPGQQKELKLGAVLPTEQAIELLRTNNLLN